jgi:hypothetical protein
MSRFDPIDAFDHGDTCDLDRLLHPSQAFDRPADVVNDPNLSLNEKRAILASWASDACAIESAPALRNNPSGRVVSFDDIMDALRALDKQAATAVAAGDRRRADRRRRRSFGGGTGQGEEGSPLY